MIKSFKQCSLCLADLSEYDRLKRYIKYNNDLIYYGSTTTVTEKYALIHLRIEPKAEWIIEYLLSEFTNLYLGIIKCQR